MRLTDIMSNANLANWAEMGMILFLAVFAAVAIKTLLNKDKKGMDAAAATPLDDGTLPESDVDESVQSETRRQS